MVTWLRPLSDGDCPQRAINEPEGLKRYTLPAYTTISPDRTSGPVRSRAGARNFQPPYPALKSAISGPSIGKKSGGLKSVLTGMRKRPSPADVVSTAE